MNRLLIYNIGHLVTMDAGRTLLRDAWISCRDGFIQEIGTGKAPELPDTERLDAHGGIALPGLINTHHHMYQNLARAYTPIANEGLLTWLAGHNHLWKNLTPEHLRVAAQVAMAELMLTGCTTTTDHHYVFPRGTTHLLDAEYEAAQLMGIRFHGCRGSMDVASEITPEILVQTTDEILKDSQRLYEKWHDPRKGSLSRLALAPCSLFSVTADLLQESARQAREWGLRLHTHCAETREEDALVLQLFGSRPLDYLRRLDWEGDHVWFAHGIHFNDAEVAVLNKYRMGVAHCPCSNMRLGSGICRVNDLRRGGSPVSIGVDGSASNDSGHMLNEVRQTLLLTRVLHGAGALTVEQALEMATLDGARNLGRTEDIGSLEAGKCADVAIFPATTLFSSGAENKIHSLLLCHAREVDHLVVHGKVRVTAGQLVGIDLPRLLEKHAALARNLHESA